MRRSCVAFPFLAAVLCGACTGPGSSTDSQHDAGMASSGGVHGSSGGVTRSSTGLSPASSGFTMSSGPSSATSAGMPSFSAPASLASSAAAAACTPRTETCDGWDEDCDGVADNGVAGCDPCTPRHELPVVTHWSNAVGGPLYLGTDQPVVNVAYPGGTHAPGTCYPYYTESRYPVVDHYVGDTWSVTAIPDAEASNVLGAVCQSTGIPIRLLRPDALGARVIARAGAVQVLHANVVDGSLATVVLPANWDAAAPAGRYPLVANGFYDLNENVFRQEGPDLVRMIALSTSGGRTGAIGVLWNGGGALASRTMNPRALEQFAAVVDFVAQHFAGDRHRILMYGGSRGGVTTLAMASNPLRRNYTVTFAAPGVPPTRIGEHSLLQSTTFPGVLDAVAWSTGLQDAWRTGWTYPSCAGHPELTGKTGPAAHLAILTGTTDPAWADAHLSVGSADYIAGLVAAGTEVYLESGTHDFIVPFAHQVQYGLDLVAAGVPLHADVLVRAGHAQRTEGGTLGAVRTNRIWDALQSYVDPSRAGERPHVIPGVSFYRVNHTTGQLEPFTPDGGVFPFTLEGPRYTARGQRFPMVLVGAPGTAWELAILPPGGGTPFSWTGSIAPEARSIVWVDVPTDLPTGDYTYSVRIQKAGGVWQDIPATGTMDGSAPLLTVVAEEPNVSGGEIAARVAGPQVAGFGGTNWGLSEY